MIKDKSFHVIQANGYVTLKIIGDDSPSAFKETEAAIFSTLVEPFPHYVINCEHLSNLAPEWARLLLKLQVELKKINKLMRLILVSPVVKNQLKIQGLDKAFQLSPSLREALVEFGLVTKKKIDTDFINPFLAATMRVLKVQAGIDARMEKIYLKEERDGYTGDVSGVIGVISEAFNGSVVISFPEKTFLHVMSGMLGEEYTELNKEIIDGAGELTNMIFGQAKILLNEKGYGIKTAIPSVVSGKDHKLSALSKGPTVIVPFKIEDHSFFVEICVSE